MHVLIINPPWPGKGFGTRSQNRIIKHRSDKFLQYPIFLAYSAAQLKKAGHKVSYIDSVIQELSMKSTLEAVQQLNPDVIFMETTTPSIMADYESLIALKKATNATMIVGGPHATYFHKQVLMECDAIDVVIRHEFDTKIAKVVDNLNDLEKIYGITWRDKNNIDEETRKNNVDEETRKNNVDEKTRKNKIDEETRKNNIVDNGDGTPEHNLDTIPFPDRKIIPWQWYLEAWYSREPFMNFMTSRGCPYHCSFCLWPQSMYGHKQRFRSLDNVFQELKFLVKEYGVKEINIDDGTFTTNKKRVIEFCRRLRQEKIDLIWTCNGRVDTIDDEMLNEMKLSGCKMIRLGVESGSQRVLDRIKKGLTLDKIEEGVKLVKKHGIQALGGFMFGFPYDSRKTIQETINFAKRLSPDQVQFSICMSYPGTSLYEYIKDNNLLLAKNFKEFDMTYGPVAKTLDMKREELLDILSKAYKEFYFRPQFFLQTLKHLKNIDEIKRVLRSVRSLIRTIRLHAKNR